MKQLTSCYSRKLVLWTPTRATGAPASSPGLEARAKRSPSSSRRSSAVDSSAVSPVGPDLVGSSVAERERVGVSFRGLVSRSLGGAGHASRLLVCVAERPPMLCDVMLIIDHHYTHTMTMIQ